MTDLDAAAVEYAAQLIAQSDALVIAAGAGMGVDSGLPDFRGNEGFWRAYPALGRTQRNFTEIASPRTFAQEPRLAWGFYGHRLQLYRNTRPHAGFGILMRWARRLMHGAFVFTSNVDGHFQKAGFDEQTVHECHGSIHWLQCSVPCTSATWPATTLEPHVDASRCEWIGDLPSCPHCGALARPNILMFGDGHWTRQRSVNQELRLRSWLSKVRRPVVLELGAGTHVPSVRMFTQEVLYIHGGRVVRINPREEIVPTPFDVGMRAGALAALRAIDDAIDFSNGWA